MTLRSILESGNLTPRASTLEKEMATHRSILAWEIPWTEEPGGATIHGSRKELETTWQLNNNNKPNSEHLLTFFKVLSSSHGYVLNNHSILIF